MNSDYLHHGIVEELLGYGVGDGGGLVWGKGLDVELKGPASSHRLDPGLPQPVNSLRNRIPFWV